MYCRILLLLIAAFLVLPSTLCAAVKVEIEVTGVSDELKKNVLARLTINLQKANERLQPNAVRILHKKAKDDIRSALAPFGFYAPTIESHLTAISDGWLAQYIIDKGPPVIVQKVDVELLGEGTDQKRLQKTVAKFPLKIGDILNQALYEKGKKRLINTVLAEGFLDAAFVTQELRINRRLNSAEIKLGLNTGAQYTFGETTSTQEVLKNDLLQRYMPYQQGDPYTPAKLYELQSILYKTEYFSRVSAKGLVADAELYIVPVELELIPPEHKNKYSFGLGYATDTGVRGKLGWSNRLFNNKGHKISALLQLAELKNTASVSLEVPVQNPRFNHMSHRLSYEDEEWEDTTTQLLTAEVSRVYTGPEFKFSAGLELRDEVYDIGNTSGEGTFVIPSVNFGYTLADNILDTKNGFQVSLGVRGGIDALFSDADFLQITLGGKAIITPFTDWRIIGRGSLGATAVESIDSLPPSLRFYAGGDSTIRGYAYKSIGTEDDSGAVIGGRFLVVGSIELERILGERWSLATFWDGGTAADDLDQDFYQGAGIGVRFRLPFGQIRFDIASAVTEDGDPLRVHLTVGGDL